jgi:hypothetical protein
MKTSDMFESKYLKAADLDEQEHIVTVKSLKQEQLGDDDKFILYFNEQKKGLVLNKTNTKIIEAEYGRETDDWTGQKIVLYPTVVEFKGDMVEAIRVRIRKGAKIAKPKHDPSEPEYDEEGYPLK